MLNETTENFLKVMATFEWPEPKPVTYRLYYNEDGSPKCYTMDDLPGKYIEVDRETYVSHLWNVKVIDGKLNIIPPAIVTNKLKPNDQAGTCCHPQDICVVVAQDHEHIKWTMTTNETY
jgi:hypothetical protein